MALFLCILLLIVSYLLAVTYSQLREFRSDAVKKGYARWDTDVYGKPVFKWNER